MKYFTVVALLTTILFSFTGCNNQSESELLKEKIISLQQEVDNLSESNKIINKSNEYESTISHLQKEIVEKDKKILEKIDEIYQLKKILEEYKEGAVDRATLNSNRHEIAILMEMITQYDRYISDSNDLSEGNDGYNNTDYSLGMSLSQAESIFGESYEMELIPHTDGTFLVKKIYQNAIIYFNPIQAVNMQLHEYMLTDGQIISAEQNYNDVIEICKSRFENAHTSNGGNLENWFKIDDDEYLIIGIDSESSLKTRNEILYIELTNISFYN